MQYSVTVTTGHKRGAGTDANVFLEVYGANGSTGKRPLRKSSTHRNKFEKGNDDVFVIEACDLGRLSRIKIGHDNSGFGGAAWSSLLLFCMVRRPVVSVVY